MLVNEFYTMVKPFFVSRGSWALTNNDMLDNYTNIALTHIYNYHEWFFKNRQETVTEYTTDWEWRRKWMLNYNIKHIINIQDQDWDSLTPSFRKIWSSRSDEYETIWCNVWENFIITSSDVNEIYVEYSIKHKFFKYENFKNNPLPVPDEFVPVLLLLVYDYASPIVYFDDDNTTPRYQIARDQLDKLKDADWITDSVYFAPAMWV